MQLPKLPTLPLALGLVAACANASGGNNTPTLLAEADSALRAYDVVLTAGDTATLRTLVTPGFRMFEDSREFDINQSNRLIGVVLGTGHMTRTLHDVVIEQRGTVAWARYRVTVRWVVGRDTMTFDRLESAVLEKRDGRWLVAFATTMPAPAP